MIYLSLVLPIYKAESFLKASFAAIDGFLSAKSYDSEVILVVDGCHSSLEICKSFVQKQHPYHVEIIINDVNQGKGFSVKQGMLQASGEYCVYLDCDLAYPIQEVDKILVALAGGVDMAIACRVLEESRFTMSPVFFRYLYTRHLAGRIFNFLVRHTLVPTILDTQPGLKGFSNSAAKQIFHRQTLNGFSFDVEILYIARFLQLTVQQVAVHFKYFNEPTTVRFLQDTIATLRDMIMIYRNGVKGRYSLRGTPTSEHETIFDRQRR